MDQQERDPPSATEGELCHLEERAQRLASALATTTASADADIGAAMDMLGRILRNVLQHPLSDAYRRIRLSGRAWAVASQCVTGGSPWLVAWCRDVLGCTVVRETGTPGEDLLLLGHKWMENVPTNGTPLETLQDPGLRAFLSVCEGCLRIVERLRSTNVAALRLMQGSGAAPPPAQRDAFDALAWLQSDAATTGLPGTGYEALTDGEWQWLSNALRSAAGCSAAHEAPPTTDVAPSATVAACWHRMTLAAAKGHAQQHSGSTRLIIWVDPEQLQAMDAQRARKEMDPQAAAKEAAKARSRNRYEAAQRAEQAKHRVLWPAELMHTATSLIVDIGGLMEVYAVMEAKREEAPSVGGGDPPLTQQMGLGSLAVGEVIDADHGTEDGCKPRRDPRVNLTRRDRIEMHRLQEKFRQDGDVTYLHELKAEWEGRLASLSRSIGTPTVFL